MRMKKTKKGEIMSVDKKNEVIILYVVESKGFNFEEIKHKVNANLTQFNVRIETDIPKELEINLLKR